MPSHFGSCILPRSERLMNNILLEIDGFYSNIIYQRVTDSAYNHKKHCSTSVEKASLANFSWVGQKRLRKFR